MLNDEDKKSLNKLWQICKLIENNILGRKMRWDDEMRWDESGIIRYIPIVSSEKENVIEI